MQIVCYINTNKDYLHGQKIKFKNDSIKIGESDGAGSTYGGEENCMQSTGGKLESSKVDVGGRIILKFT